MKAHVLGAWAAPRGVPGRLAPARLPRLPRRDGPAAALVGPAAGLRRWRSRARSPPTPPRSLGPRVPVRTIYNAVDLARFAPGPATAAGLDAAPGCPRRRRARSASAWWPRSPRWKGHDVFLDAVARLDRPICRAGSTSSAGRSTGRGARSGPLEELQARAEALGLAGRVGFAGHQADPAAAIRALDVVVHASTRPEPFGRVIVEGMACGRAVVAVADGGAAELFEDGVTALGCPPGDPGAGRGLAG